LVSSTTKRREGKSIREISKELRMSSRDIVAIHKKADESNLYEEFLDQKQLELNFEQSVYTEALKLFREGKSLLDVTIELGVKAEVTKKAYLDFLDTKTLGEFGGIYEDVKDCLPALVALYESMRNKGLGIRDTIVALEYASNMKKAQGQLESLAGAVVGTAIREIDVRETKKRL
jgi:hypothetical protein